MARKRPSISTGILFAWLMLSGLIFFLAPEGITNKFHFAFISLFKPVLSIGKSISLSAFSSSAAAETVSRREYVRLQNHAANLLAQLQQEHQKTERLAGLRDRFALESAAFVLADIITVSIDALKHELVINRGTDDGLAKGQFVLGCNSIIGVIDEIASATAKVKLTTDSRCRLHVKIAASDVYIRGIMHGDGKSGAAGRSAAPGIYFLNLADGSVPAPFAHHADLLG